MFCSLSREQSLPSWLFSPQSRHRTHRLGRDGPEPHHEHERPRFCGKDPDPRSLLVAPPSERRSSSSSSSSSMGTLLFSHPVSSEPIQQVCAFNRTVSKVQDFLQNEAKGSKVIGAESLEDMVSKLKKPRRVILLVKAGKAVDDFIDKLVGSFCAQLNSRKQFATAGCVSTGGVLPSGSSFGGRGHHHRRRQLGVQRHNGKVTRETPCPGLFGGHSGYLTQQSVFFFFYFPSAGVRV